MHPKLSSGTLVSKTAQQIGYSGSHLRAVFERFVAVLCALVMILSMVSPLSAQDEELPVVQDDDNKFAAYTLGPGDKIKITVFNQDDLTGSYSLDGKGSFSMPLIGSVEADGLTSTELEKLLVSKLKPDYLVNPRIYVEVMNYRPYYLMGEVNSTGAFPYVAGMSYLTAIAIAGGFSYRAKQDHVFVIRANDSSQQEIKLSIDEKVQPGDIIRVDERMF